MSFDCSAPTAASARRSPIPTHPTALSTAQPTPATHRSQRQGPHSKDDGQQPPHHDHHNDRKINEPRRQRPDQLPPNNHMSSLRDRSHTRSSHLSASN